MADRRCGRKISLLLQLSIWASLYVLCQSQTVTVLLDAYSPTSTLTDNPSTLPLGATVILSCRTAGIPQGTDYSYTWSCPRGSSCNIGQGRNPNRKTYEDSLVLHILSTADTGTYTCSVGLATGELLGMDQFEIVVAGGLVLHHGSNLIADNELITDVQDITSDGITSISCATTDQQQPQWRGPNGEITSTDTSLPLYVNPSSNTAILLINRNNISNFTNAEFTCNTTQHTARVNLYFGLGGTLGTPKLFGQRNGVYTQFNLQAIMGMPLPDRYIFSYERQDLNIPLEVEYQEVEGVQTGVVKPVAVPGVTYKIVLWAVEGNQYSGAPSSGKTFLQVGQAPSAPRSLTVTRTFTGGLELNWIPPKETNAQFIIYEIQYGLTTSESDYTTVNTNRSSTYYNLPGLQNTTYYIRVVAVNYITVSGVARTEGEWITAAVTSASNDIDTLTIGIAAGVGGGVVLILIIVILVVVIACLVARRRGGKEKQHPPPAYYNAPGEGEKDETILIADRTEDGYIYCNKDSPHQQTDKSHTSYDSGHRDNAGIMSNEQVASKTAHQQSQNHTSDSPAEYATTDGIGGNNNTTATPLQQEYDTVGSPRPVSSSGPPVELDAEYTSIPGNPSAQEYSTVDELDQKTKSTTARAIAMSVDSTSNSGMQQQPQVDPGYEPMDNKLPTPPPAGGYETIDTTRPPVVASSGAGRYVNVKDTQPVASSGNETDETVHPTVVTVPTGNYETVDKRPGERMNSEYEMIDTPGINATSSTTQHQPSGSNDIYSDVDADVYAEPQVPKTPTSVASPGNLEVPESNPSELYTVPDMTQKKRMRSTPDDSKASKYAPPDVPEFDPELLYSQPDKTAKGSH